MRSMLISEQKKQNVNVRSEQKCRKRVSNFYADDKRIYSFSRASNYFKNVSPIHFCLVSRMAKEWKNTRDPFGVQNYTLYVIFTVWAHATEKNKTKNYSAIEQKTWRLLCSGCLFDFKISVAIFRIRYFFHKRGSSSPLFRINVSVWNGNISWSISPKRKIKLCIWCRGSKFSSMKRIFSLRDF